MPLSDWLGTSRQDGFSCHLQVIASQLGLEGEIVDDVGYYDVWGRTAMHPMTICLEGGSVAIRIFSNARFPPGQLPQEVVVMLMEWSASAQYFSWDGYSSSQWSCFFIRYRLQLNSLSAASLKDCIDEALVEVAALDNMLTSSGYGRPGSQAGIGSRASARRPRGLPVPAPSSSDSVPAYVFQLARRLLGGPKQGGS